MRKGILLLAFILFFITGCRNKEVYDKINELEEGEEVKEMDVFSSSPMRTGNIYTESIDVVLYQEVVDDYEKCVMEILEHCRKNDFHSTKFSYDIAGYPNILEATVFLTEKDIEEYMPAFKVIYEAESTDYNIVENKDKYSFKLEIF